VTEFVPYTVVHALPGRIRLRIPRLKTDPEFARQYLEYVAAQPGVSRLRANQACASVVVEYVPDQLEPTQVAAALTALVAQGQPKSLAGAPPLSTAPERPWWRRLIAPTVGLGLAAVGAPPLLAAASLAIASLPIAKGAARALLRERRLNVDVLDTTAITLMAAQGSFLAPAGIAWLIALGHSIHDQTARASRRETTSLLATLRRQAWVLRGGQAVQVPAHTITSAETVLVHPGELVLVDGTVLSGTALLDQSMLTGEAGPVRRTTGERVLAGTLVREGALRVSAERVGDATRAGQIVRLLDAAPVQDTRAGNYAAKFADRLVAPTFGAALLATGATASLSRGVSLLIVDFATGIRIAAPIATLSTMQRAARTGMLIRSGRAMEQLAGVDAVVFDKTGTLTTGRPAVVDIRGFQDRWTVRQLLCWAASAERGLTHPAASAIRAEAARQDLDTLDQQHWRYHLGLGVSAVIDGRAIAVGSARFLREQGIVVESRALEAKPAATIIYVAVDGKLGGAIICEDPIRPEAPRVLEALRRAGVRHTMLLTGDSRCAGDYVARQVGIDAVVAESFPEQKAAIVRDLRRRGYRVAFVGDGINDSPALAYADVSVSLRDAADVARETADIVLMERGIAALPEAIQLCRDGLRTIRQSIGIVAVPNALALGLAAAGLLSPIAATLLNNGSAIVAGLHALRPVRRSRQDPADDASAA